MKIESAKLKTMAVIVKLQFQPSFSSTQTITVQLMRPPRQREKKNQLKKAEMSLWLP